MTVTHSLTTALCNLLAEILDLILKWCRGIGAVRVQHVHLDKPSMSDVKYLISQEPFYGVGGSNYTWALEKGPASIN